MAKEKRVCPMPAATSMQLMRSHAPHTARTLAAPFTLGSSHSVLSTSHDWPVSFWLVVRVLNDVITATGDLGTGGTNIHWGRTSENAEAGFRKPFPNASLRDGIGLLLSFDNRPKTSVIV